MSVRQCVVTNLPVSLNGRLPNMLEPESFTVVDQSDGLDVLSQLCVKGVRLGEG